MANNIHTTNKKKDMETEKITSGKFQPEEINIISEKRERRTMTTETGRSIVEFICVFI